MATLYDIYRSACSHASVEPPAFVEDDDSPSGDACNTFFLPLYQAFIELGDWKWAIRRQTISARTAHNEGHSDYRDPYGYVVLDTEDLPDYSYKYEIPVDYYGFGTPGYDRNPDRDRSAVRVLGIVKDAEVDLGDQQPGTTPESQDSWTQEGEYVYTDFSNTERPPVTDPNRGEWLPTLVLQFVATVDVRFARGPFVEALEAFLGAKLAMKFRRQAEPVQELVAYGQAQLQLALQSLPEPVDYRAITFTSVRDVPASAQTGR